LIIIDKSIKKVKKVLIFLLICVIIRCGQHRAAAAYTLLIQGDLIIMIISTLVAMAAGYVLSVVLGTPEIIRADRYISKLCSLLEEKISSKYEDSEGGQHTAGIVYMLALLLITLVPLLIVLILLYCFIPVLAIVLDALICWSVIDIKGISKTATTAARAVRANNTLRAARSATKLSALDCSELETENLVRASVQGIADRTVDSSAAPLLYMILLSGVGGVFWKAVDTASYGEYRSEAFIEPMKKLRDALCFIPGKLAPMIMLVDALFLKLNTRAAEKALKRDGKKCRRVCFGGCRAVLAGITGISLLPEEVYSEQFLRTYTIGEHLKEPSAQDISLANQLMHGTTFIILALFFIIKLTFGVWF
jgi:cobalamin biosynthesis protein CobD/CbiB